MMNIKKLFQDTVIYFTQKMKFELSIEFSQ